VNTNYHTGRIREGYRPHPWHWQALAQLVGVSAISKAGQPAIEGTVDAGFGQIPTRTVTYSHPRNGWRGMRRMASQAWVIDGWPAYAGNPIRCKSF
jgi:hypothetical protein